ncbi:MAG: FHA domain-containing protein, partial [Anaerolineales bacterium]|nr:FHA domain-containing protein [Anaerolineales bacterium]
QHARIEFDGANYKISDLNSTNGTYLANARLLPGVPEVWTPDKALRIGDTWLRLQRTRSSSTATRTVEGTIVAKSPATGVDMTRVSTSAGQRVGIFIETAQLNVEPGDNITIPIVLFNQGPTVDHFKISVTGVPAPWVTAPPKPLHLMPGEQQETSIAVHPRRDSQSRAGRYPISISVISQDMPNEFVEAKANLTVSAFTQYSSELYPQKLRASSIAPQVGRVTINNQGNTQESFALSWKDRGDELVFEPPQAQAKVAEGKQVAVEFRVAPRRRRWIGSEKAHPFSVQVSPTSGQTQTHSGEATSRALIPMWLPPLLIFLCMALAVGLALLYNSYISQANQATRTLLAQQTQVALAAQQTSQAFTATTDALSNANMSTVQALTATASWLMADDDRDGLSNEKELALGTLPNKRDTDEDGLDDANELDRGTQPLKPDTDGDGLKDGAEVASGINPLSPDSDGDGIPDSQDENPGATNTPLPTNTPASTPIVTIQITPTSPPTPKMTRISFASGATSATVDGTLNSGEVIDYTIRAQAGQIMLVDVYSPADNVYLGVVGLSDGSPLLRTAAEATLFRGKLPATQDYRLSLAAPFTSSNYTLQVIIPARIQFQPGAVSASIPGKLAGGETNYYLAWANAGQTMSVKIKSPGNDVLLTIYGFEDGIPLVRYVSDAWEWSGVLPAAQDYMIEAVSVGGTTNYTVEIRIE